jgi:DNA modification methylase
VIDRPHLGNIDLAAIGGRSGSASDIDGNQAVALPSYSGVPSIQQLRTSAQVATAIASVDWSFSDANTGFLTHDLHPYPAKFIPQIPGYCISMLSRPGELVLDPFGGSGTTALESVRLGRRALSIDANHVGTLLGRVKTCNLDRSSSIELHSIHASLSALQASLPSADSLCASYKQHIPDIPNIDKWFPLSSRGELAAIRARISRCGDPNTRDIASLALSRIVLSASFQDSETRYSSKPRLIPQGLVLSKFLRALETIGRSVSGTQPALRYGVSEFVTADTRTLGEDASRQETVDLIVTSPPYGNATDYHLYHRFRLMWLGYDPRALGRMEIGSHLRHQKESSGFDDYAAEMEQVLLQLLPLLKPGRFAVLVIGDAIYNKILYPAAKLLGERAEQIGFEQVCIQERQLPTHRRSFTAAGRRATSENLLVLRKPDRATAIVLSEPPYKLWPYEKVLRQREIAALLRVKAGHGKSAFEGDPIQLRTAQRANARHLAFTHSMDRMGGSREPTWQAILENGLALEPSARKDPKYVTHGLHAYKGKFYPQLAKALINTSMCAPGASVLDPFCGSGTTLLESYLNGHVGYGCDMNPLAAKIARAKTVILEINPDVVTEAIGSLVRRIDDAPKKLPAAGANISDDCLEEVHSWFASPIVRKVDWLLGAIRDVSDGVVRDFLEVVFSNIVREISHQDPDDLRIRRRKTPLSDADVFGIFLDALDIQYGRVQKFWGVRGYAPTRLMPAFAIEGDSREHGCLKQLGLSSRTVDLVLTSPPYATALPYIDTDRLSLLLLFGMRSASRRPVEHSLIGSREIAVGERRDMESTIEAGVEQLPEQVGDYLIDLHSRVQVADVGFRRKNMPALILRFLLDMDRVIVNCTTVMKNRAEMMMVIGDNRMKVGDDYERVPTTDLVQAIAVRRGLALQERLSITVTKEGLLNNKHAITENVVLKLRR